MAEAAWLKDGETGGPQASSPADVASVRQETKASRSDTTTAGVSSSSERVASAQKVHKTLNAQGIVAPGQAFEANPDFHMMLQIDALKLIKIKGRSAMPVAFGRIESPAST